MTTKYTFLLPAYKAKYFREALISIRQQTYTDFVCMVSDDCSPEDLKSIYDEVLGDDPRFTYRRNAENMGSKSLVSHWNLLVDMCQTEYLIIASDDDVYDRRFLDEIDNLATRYYEVNLIRGRVKKINAKGDVIEEDPRMDVYQEQDAFFNSILRKGAIHCIGNYVFRTDGLRKKLFIDFPLAWFSDDATIYMCAKSGVATTDSFVFFFRDGGNNISREEKTSKEHRKMKIDASRLFLQWMEDTISAKLQQSDVERKESCSIMEACRVRVIDQIWKYNHSLGFAYSLDVFRWLCRNGFLKGRKAKLTYWWDRLKDTFLK